MGNFRLVGTCWNFRKESGNTRVDNIIKAVEIKCLCFFHNVRLLYPNWNILSPEYFLHDQEILIQKMNLSFNNN